MGLLRRLFRRDPARRIVDLDQLAAPRERGRVELHGVIEAITTVPDPTGGAPCVALEYRAWPQSTTVGIAGAAPEGSRAFQLAYHQAVDFVLADRGRRVLVRVDRGADLARVHHDLLARFGVGLRHDLRRLCDGDRVGVVGRLDPPGPAASPHRAEPYLAVLRAERLWPLEE